MEVGKPDSRSSGSSLLPQISQKIIYILNFNSLSNHHDALYSLLFSNVTLKMAVHVTCFILKVGKMINSF